MVDEIAGESLLSALKTARGTVSGASVGRAEGVSRTALWKRVQTLRRLGYQIEAAAGGGYRLGGAARRAYRGGMQAATALRVTVRWPNDLLIDGRKVVGIGIELASEQDVLHYVVLGIGINVNLTQEDFPPDLQPIATSLRQVLGREGPRPPLLQRVLERIEALYDHYLEEGPHAVLDAWRALPTILGQRIAVEELRERWEGTAVDLDDQGALLVRADDGALHRVLAGAARVGAGAGP